MFNFSLGSFCAFQIFDDLVSRKRLVVERNRPKFEPLGQVFSVCRVVLTVKCAIKFSLWSFGAFLIFRDLVSWKLLVVEQNGLKFGP